MQKPWICLLLLPRLLRMLIQFSSRRTRQTSQKRNPNMTNPRSARKTLPREPLKSEPPKRETTVITGLPTPDQSFQVSSGTVTPVTPKEEELDDKKPLSNTIEGASPFSRFNHGLSVHPETVDLSADEDSPTQEMKRQIRSPSRKSINWIASHRHKYSHLSQPPFGPPFLVRFANHQFHAVHLWHLQLLLALPSHPRWHPRWQPNR